MICVYPEKFPQHDSRLKLFLFLYIFLPLLDYHTVITSDILLFLLLFYGYYWEDWRFYIAVLFCYAIVWLLYSFK